MKKIVLIISFVLSISGCTSLNVQSAKNIGESEICVIENKSINPDFTTAYLRQIKSNGYKAKLISRENKSACEFTSTYTATYGQHWGVYLATSELTIYKNNNVIGRAKYKAPYASPAKHGRVEDKIDEMVNELLPAL